jgi:hypothetical protein
MVGGELGELLEERALLRPFDMALDRQHALGLGQLEDRVHQAEQLEIVLLGVLGALEGRADALAGVGEHVLGVGDDEGADRGAEDDQVLEGLPEHPEVPAAAGVAAADAAQHHQPADDRKHADPRSPERRRLHPLPILGIFPPANKGVVERSANTGGFAAAIRAK